MNELKEFDQLKAEVSVFVGPVKTIAVKSAEQSAVAITTAKQVKEYAKKIEDRRKAIVKPLNDMVDRVNAYAKEIKAPLDQAEAHIKGELLSWERELEKKRREEFEKAEAERKRLEAEAQLKMAAEREAAETVAMFAAPETANLSKAVIEAEEARVQKELEKAHADKVADINANKVSGVRKTWTFEIRDAASVPRDFLSVDEKKIREAIRLGVREIQGINIYQETSVAIR